MKRWIGAAVSVLTAAAGLAATPSASPAMAATIATTLTPVQETANATMRLVLRRYWTRSGFTSTLSGRVVDPSGATIWSLAATTPRRPASNEKLVTAYVALTALGAGSTQRTSVMRSSASPATVYLRGGGDPSLTSARVKALAATTATRLKGEGRTSVTVRFDDSLFPAPTNAAGWKPEWVPDTVAPVRALVVDGHNVMDTSLDAAAVFATALRANGLTPTTPARATTPSAGAEVAGSNGPTLATQVGLMLRDSQNDTAEALLRLAARKRGYATTWDGARANARATLVAAGLPMSGVAIFDGSGLSMSGRQTVGSLAALIAEVRATPALRSVMFGDPGIAVAGVSGTLEDRFLTGPQACARGRIQAKTGSLSHVMALSGIANGVDGRVRTFSLLADGPESTTSNRDRLDQLAAAATGCLL